MSEHHATDATIGTPVTRVEILDALDDVFDGGALSKYDLVDAAIAASARPGVLELLRTLPEDQRLRQRADLWEHLPDVPVGA
ncbi:MAG: hypothetical protein U5K30_13350 [Acidimicrobiales bacterium]|nr:hypothetical protein [Acidimicrobiales bacterium]